MLHQQGMGGSAEAMEADSTRPSPATNLNTVIAAAAACVDGVGGDGGGAEERDFQLLPLRAVVGVYAPTTLEAAVVEVADGCASNGAASERLTPFLTGTAHARCALFDRNLHSRRCRSHACSA
jgi:hypothetical protein